MKAHVSTPGHDPCAEYQILVRKLRDELDQYKAVSKDIVSEACHLLRSIHDLQNGPPLIKYEKEWEETMNNIADFLNTFEKKHNEQ